MIELAAGTWEIRDLWRRLDPILRRYHTRWEAIAATAAGDGTP